MTRPARTAAPPEPAPRTAHTAGTWQQPEPGGPLLRRAAPAASPGASAGPASPADGSRPAAVLFDRDGTLVEDVPHNTDPDRLRPRPLARTALDALRAAGVPLGVVTNQPDLARGALTVRQLESLHERLELLLGPFAVTAVCPHTPEQGCGCRKPAPGLVHAACRALHVPPRRAAVVGDIGADLEAAAACGARGVLVPTEATRAAEIDAARHTADNLALAVRRLLGRDRRTGGG
ncbi:D-glycero-alpha-D-manno-heptose-1,7-bisphosphate 7-phosphatase [Streptomyces sp. NRRL S-1868]|uniref:D-glycero-alpha-D-manno-heptose-1,7-bisphosphate 7-phosphatase n=1 Tax=Streptomyces sp. NRRL S-1868 TaxID=1463892 RepID=UPI00099D3E32|nr:HAD-IIIA family hydrolase [Streptomyces sp. NRRL S-1868]